jgi:putative colanic acid biosynthesis UDP-glucose lipid carrier transferase
MEEFDPRRASFPKFQDREENSGGGRTEELSEALRNVGNQRSGVRSGLNKVLSFEPLTPVRDLIIVGEGPAAEEIFHYCHEHTVRGYRFRGVFHDKAITGVLSSRQLGSIDAAKAFATQNRIDILYCALPSSYREEINGLMEFCERNTIRFRVIPSTDSFIPVADAADLTYHGAVPVSRLRNEPLDRWSARFVKRAFDIVFSFLVITLIFSWLFPILAILVKLSSKGPVFFKQDRLGERRKKFSCYKFRSMRTNVDSDMKQATKDDPRITRIGAFLRKTSLDEFPQFFNVLDG